MTTLLHLGLVLPSIYYRDIPIIIIDCNIVRAGTPHPYAFIDFATPQTAMEALVLDTVPFMGTQLSVRRPDKSSRRQEIASFRWDDLVVGDLPTTTKHAAEQYPSRNDDRELYLFNLTPKMTDELLLLFLNSAMKQARLTRLAADSPITRCTLHQQSRYAVLEFRNRDEATKALFLNRIPFMGLTLGITRCQPSSDHGSLLLDRNPCHWQSALERFTVPGTTSNDDRANSQARLALHLNARVPEGEDQQSCQEVVISGFNPQVENIHLILTDYVDAMLQIMGSTTIPGIPTVISSRCTGGSIVLLLSSPEAATAALQLDHMPFIGTTLSVNRPGRYNKGSSQDSPIDDWKTLLTRYRNHRSADPLITPSQLAKRCPGDNELFLSHIPSELLSESNLITFLGSAAEQLGLMSSSTSTSSRVLSRPMMITEYRVTGTWGFLRFKNPQDTTNALALDKIPIMGTRLRLERPRRWTGSRTPCSNISWPEALRKLCIPCDPSQQQQSAALSSIQQPPFISIRRRNRITINPHISEGQELKSSSERDENERNRDESKQVESTTVPHHPLKKENIMATAAQKVVASDGNKRDESLITETINKQLEDARDQVQIQTEKVVAAHAELTLLKTTLTKVMTNQHQHQHQHQRPNNPVNEQLVIENDKFQQTIAHMQKAAAVESRTLEDLRSRLNTTETKNQRIVDIMTNSMDELISERKSRRQLEERMDAALQLEKTQRVKAEMEIETLRAALATASRSRIISVPSISPKTVNNAFRKSIKRENEDA